MKAHVTYTRDGRIASIGVGAGLLPDDDADTAEIELPADFPGLTGPNAEQEALRAAARLSRSGPRPG
jgi:hypothetical protein